MLSLYRRICKSTLEQCIADIKHRASKSFSILDSDDVFLFHLQLCNMLAVRSFERCDLSIDCLRHTCFFVKCLSISRQAEVWESGLETQVGQVKTPTTCLEMSIENISTCLRLGVTSWGQQVRFGQLKTPTTCLEINKDEISKIGRLKLGVDPGDQVRCLDK